MITDQEIKDRLFKLWAEHQVKYGIFPKLYYQNRYSRVYQYKTISEIKALMLKDGIEMSEINKIIGG